MAGGSQHHSCAKLTLSTSLTEKSGGSGTLSATCMCPAAVWRCYMTSLRIDAILSRNPAPPTSWRLQHIRSWNSWALSLGSKVTHSTWTWLPGPTMRCSIAWVHGETPHAALLDCSSGWPERVGEEKVGWNQAWLNLGSTQHWSIKVGAENWHVFSQSTNCTVGLDVLSRLGYTKLLREAGLWVTRFIFDNYKIT